MKTLLILVLLLALAVAAFFTKPNLAGFKNYYQQQQPGQQSTISVKGLESVFTSSMYLNSIVFRDHILWVTIEQNGVTQYTGAFGHWFKSKAATPEAS